DPMESIEKLRDEKKIIKTMSDDQIRKLLDVCGKETFVGYRNFVFILMLLDTGLRLDEALNINLSNIYWDERMIKVFGKSSKERYVPFGTALMELLHEYLRMRGTLE